MYSKYETELLCTIQDASDNLYILAISIKATHVLQVTFNPILKFQDDFITPKNKLKEISERLSEWVF